MVYDSTIGRNVYTRALSLHSCECANTFLLFFLMFMAEWDFMLFMWWCDCLCNKFVSHCVWERIHCTFSPSRHYCQSAEPNYTSYTQKWKFAKILGYAIIIITPKKKYNKLKKEENSVGIILHSHNHKYTCAVSRSLLPLTDSHT